MEPEPIEDFAIRTVIRTLEYRNIIIRNHNVTEEMMIDNGLVRDLYVRDVLQNPNVTMKLLTYLTRNSHYEININSELISSNPRIPIEIFLNEIDNFVNFACLSTHPDVEIILLQYPDRRWDFATLSKHVKWSTVQMLPHKPWDYLKLSGNPNITFDIVLENPRKPWDYNILSGNPAITWSMIRGNPGKPWNFYVLSSNPSINWSMVMEMPKKRWDYGELSKNYNITLEIVLDNPDKPWCYHTLASNPNITWEHFKMHRRLFNIRDFSKNPSLTWTIVRDNLDEKWDMGEVCNNLMSKHPFFNNKCLDYVLK
jgi:hypothetical protein